MDSPNASNEAEVWADLQPDSWSNAISSDGNIFTNLYSFTKELIERELEFKKHDIIIEVGCGTGEVISNISTSVPRVGVDINESFISLCQSRYPDINFFVVDATGLVEWFRSSPFKDCKSPLIICANNTMNIIPLSIRYGVVQQMRLVCGARGRVMVSYWNGRYFSHGVASFYRHNPTLCGPVDVKRDVDWANNTLVTSSQYHTQWLTPEKVIRLMRSYDIDIQESSTLIKDDFMLVEDLGIFVFFSSLTSGARDIYDSDEAQKFYSDVWGGGTAHLGVYKSVKLSVDPHVLSSQIMAAQILHEEQFCDVVRRNIEHIEVDGKRVPIPCRFLDMGSGYGSFLRRVREEGFMRNGIGIDFSAHMCQQCYVNNQLANMTDVIEIRNESFLDMSVEDEAVDVVISMDAFYHVGANRHRQILKEAHRVLRPGGWLLFSDVMEFDGINKAELQPIYDATHVTSLGSVNAYAKHASDLGYKGFSFESHAANVNTHYEAILNLVKILRHHPDPRKRFDVSESFYNSLVTSMTTWRDLAAGRIEWGFFTMRKV
mmetsp:Transcript_25865/g.43634  ORF Transcript_25865/g.43634 Transcript_25865/m.43634 type:complete len:545 (+) Transcript_25865:84-1718(+)|eukprot:CAMPEP_0114415302 /NCGR_PEP_ID=MMETSP0103-20121206/1839_1 /TAXON_ID=37642 ORGANISM="Paraphysomonas imperforata, Strain PA2" /NCGR_SAMPLE_ID=MMETSP0103 /ASSEMBLY_ACC=CAM_ASM_000201 /LENGTH=544 /DNA_ID=CAMNT_0001583481 /DNA_START=23 /DNA_END=1657 /DNA_ORIENTATION=+